MDGKERTNYNGAFVFFGGELQHQVPWDILLYFAFYLWNKGLIITITEDNASREDGPGQAW